MKTLIYSNVFVALCAAVLTAGTYGLLDQSLDFMLVLHVFGVTLLAYNVQRLVRLRKFSNHTSQVRWYLANKGLLYALLAIGALLAGITFLKLDYLLLIKLAPIALLSIFYSIPFIPSAKAPMAIRDIPGAKVFIIAIVWTVVTIVLPWVHSGAQWTLDASLYGLQRFLFIVAITIPFDMRDLKYDEARLATIPQLIGYFKAKRLAEILLLLCFALDCYLTYGQHGPFHGLPGLFYVAVAAAIERIRADSPDLYFTGILDGSMLLLGILLLLG